MLLHCPHCRHELHVDQNPLPEQLSCDACGSCFRSEPDVTIFSTPKNRRDFREDSTDRPLRLQCPDCDNSLDFTQQSLPASVHCDVCGSTFESHPEATSDFDLPTQTHELAHFELLEEVGSGSYGVVWKARDTRLDRIVALKIPRRERLTPNEVERFLVEAQTAAQLRHPGIVSIHDTGRVRHTVYIATDFVEGQTLDHWLETHPVTPAVAADLCAQLADALHHAHESGVIHRDIKPSNILVDGQNRPYITDFGLAKRESVDATLAVEGSLLGTPAYMSPEQARGESHWADRRSDLYSLGTILFQMLTGERPFRGSRQMILQQVIEAEAPPPRRYSSNVPDDLNTICLKCLEKVPARRYESCSELADELRRYLRGEPIKAHPITRSKRLWRWCLRNPMMAGLLAALALTLVIGFAVSTTQWIRANLHAASAIAEADRASRAAEMARRARQRTEQYLYVAHMNMAQQAYELADPQLVIDLLDRHRPGPGQGDDRRSFEWFYWRRQAQRWSKSIAHTAPLNAVAISGDGSIIATAANDGKIHLHETVSGDHLRELVGHQGDVFAIAFAPHDRSTLVSSGSDRTIRIWDPDSGTQRWKLDLERAAFSLAFNRDGSVLVSGGADTKVRLWDVATDSETMPLSQRRMMQGHFDFVYAVDISPDGKFIASGGLDRTVRLWDADTGQPRSTMSGHHLEVWSVAFSPDGQTLASGSADRTVGLWSVAEGQSIAMLEGHSDRVRRVAFSPDGLLLVSASHDRTIRLWDMTAESKPLAVDVRKLNRRDAHFFERMKLPNSGFPLDEFKGHAGHVTGLAWSRNGKTLVSTSSDQTARLWNVSELQRRSSLGDHAKTVNALAVSEDGRTMLSASNDRTARFWDLATMQQVGQPIEHREGVLAVALAPDGRMYATGGYDVDVRLGTLSGVAEPTLLQGHQRAVSSLAFSRDSALLASASHDASVRIWDVETGQLRRTFSDHRSRVQAVTFLSDQRVASAGSDKSIRIWNPTTGQTSSQLDGHTATVWALAVAPDGSLLASGGEDCSIRLWDLRGGGKLLRTIDAHAEPVRCLAFCPDGHTLASSGDDKTIKLWDIVTGEPKSAFKGHKYRVWSLGFTPNGENLFSASLVIRIWRAPR